jgi:hypothetical protein
LTRGISNDPDADVARLGTEIQSTDSASKPVAAPTSTSSSSRYSEKSALEGQRHLKKARDSSTFRSRFPWIWIWILIWLVLETWIAIRIFAYIDFIWFYVQMCLEIHCQNGHSHRKYPATPERSEGDSLFKAKRSDCESPSDAEHSDRKSLFRPGHSHRKSPASPGGSDRESFPNSGRADRKSIFAAEHPECESLFKAERSDRESLVNTTGSDCESLFNGDCLAGDSLFGEANCGSARFIARKVPNFFARLFSAALM